ncbi:uncharacterized protein N7446_003084 [Penicillium canescens]|uniref:Uncharacterized protein n=1 Tax=Penicillium canescens TaxID=5083 RepID=A0AAD6NAE0_PENCN|nr:uncharacterized protein N7446_003084 [Penicillium canescens]KAJ6044889.1 hypothetical protein N7460_006244 [Penicillium canescens]KAJ6056358.1 hypothetical protein N7444_005456 [Penicillium canescens]KAJ6075307.1 hypothetical protein N7446_003084 [Penicillium canescens]
MSVGKADLESTNQKCQREKDELDTKYQSEAQGLLLKVNEWPREAREPPSKVVSNQPDPSKLVGHSELTSKHKTMVQARTMLLQHFNIALSGAQARAVVVFVWPGIP